MDDESQKDVYGPRPVVLAHTENSKEPAAEGEVRSIALPSTNPKKRKEPSLESQMKGISKPNSCAPSFESKRKLPQWMAKEMEKGPSPALAALLELIGGIVAAPPAKGDGVTASVEDTIAKYARDHFSMREHQLDGVHFMVNLLLGKAKGIEKDDLFVMLGDEMGLGKTVQILSTCVCIHDYQKIIPTPLHRGVFVIVVPRVIIPNFVKNGQEFLGIPRSHFIEYTGPNRHKRLRESINLCSLGARGRLTYPVFILCNPEIIRSDGIHCPLFQLPLTLLIMDEAHKIKNHDTQTNRLMRRFRASSKSGAQVGSRGFLFSTATFVCNGMEDLLGYVAVYGGTAKMQMVTQWVKFASHHAIQRYFGNHMVRRTVSILKDALPDRKELLVPVVPTQIESSMIDLLSDAATSVWSTHEAAKRDADISSEEKSRLSAMILVNILRLRQGCICADLVSGEENKAGKSEKAIYRCCIRCFALDGASSRLRRLACGHLLCQKCEDGLPITLKHFSPLPPVPNHCGLCSLLAHHRATGSPQGTSTKFFYALRILQTMLRQDEEAAVLVFSEFKRAIDLFSTLCKEAKIPVFMMHGELSDGAKKAVMEEFMDSSCPTRVMLLTMGTGGVGLNLQRANRMIILDPTWDPKKEEQAIGRIYRIGQEKDVRIVRLAYLNAVEDAMRMLQAKKHAEARVVNEAVAYGGSTTKDTVELDFHDKTVSSRDIEKFMIALREIVQENFEKRLGGERVAELKEKQRELEVKLGVPPGWLTPDWSFLSFSK